MDGMTAPPVFSAHDLVAFTPPGSPRTYRLAPLTYRERIAFRTALAREAGMRPSPQAVADILRRGAHAGLAREGRSEGNALAIG